MTPTIPERWREPLARLQRNGPYDDRFERAILEDLGSAETLLLKCRKFIDRHSEKWYTPGQALLIQIDTLIGLDQGEVNDTRIQTTPEVTSS